MGNTVSTSVIDQAPGLGGGCGDIDPLGITGTPVIDTAKRELFAAEETAVGGSSWQDIRHWLVAVSLTTHRELWHHEIDPPHANNPNYYYIPALQQRPAATLLDGRVYVEFGGLSGDCGQYHGYVVDVAGDRAGGRCRTYQVPSQREGGNLEHRRRVRVAEGEPLRRDRQRELGHARAVRRGQRRGRAVAVAAPARVLRPEQLGAAQRQRLGPRLWRARWPCPTRHCSSSRASRDLAVHPASS